MSMTRENYEHCDDLLASRSELFEHGFWKRVMRMAPSVVMKRLVWKVRRFTHNGEAPRNRRYCPYGKNSKISARKPDHPQPKAILPEQSSILNLKSITLSLPRGRMRTQKKRRRNNVGKETESEELKAGEGSEEHVLNS